MPTPKTLREKIIQIAQKEIGVSEPRGDDKYISWYNQATGSKLSMSVSWCAIFVSWVLRQAGVSTTLAPNYCSCTTAMRTFKDKGTWRAQGSYTPKAGDLVFFDWDRDPSVSEHTGIVEKVDGAYVYTIEGNTGAGTVARKQYKLTSANIIGYIEWDGKSQSQNTVNSGSTIIKTIQTRLNAKYSAGLVIDGSFGPASKKAMIKAVQTEINRLYDKKLTVDGSWGPASKKACPGVIRGARGDLVWLLQACLNAKGISLDLDSSFGPATETAVKSFQRSNGLTVDGSAGPATWTKLLA